MGGFSPTGGEAPQKPAQAQKRTYCPEPARRCRPRQWAEVCGPCAGEHPAPRSAPRVVAGGRCRAAAGAHLWFAAGAFHRVRHCGAVVGVARGSRFLRRVGAVPACAASPAPLGAAGGGDCVSCGVVHLPAELFGRSAAVRREHCPKPERPPWQRAAGGPGRQCGAAGAVFAAGRPARYRGAGRCGPAPCGCPAAGSNAAARCCAAGAGRGRACCARLPAAVGRLDGGVGGFLLGAAAGPVGQARYRKLPPEPLPPL